MAVKERPQLVPSFYLRNFAVDEEKAHVALYNQETRKFLHQAAILDQDADPGLYALDGTAEAAYGQFVHSAPRLFAAPTTKIIPPNYGEDLNLFKKYVLFQLLRSHKSAMQWMDAAGERILTQWPAFRKPGRAPAPGTDEYSASASLLHALRYLPQMNYLAIKSFVNLTPLSFFTSDNPVVVCNQWTTQRGQGMGATAIGAMGLQLFIPIHPRLMYCLYDPGTYEFREKEYPFVKIESQESVEQLNILHYLSSRTHLYFDESIQKGYIHSLVQAYGAQKNSKNPVFPVEAYGVNGNSDSFLLHPFSAPHFPLDLPFLKTKEGVRTAAINSDFTAHRHPSWSAMAGRAY
jgi:hypothetical protein